MRIMMSAAGSVVAPGIIRHLQMELGHFVIGHDCSHHGFGGDLVDEFHFSPDIAAKPQEYLDFLDRVTGDLYLPFLDEELRLPGFGTVVGVNLPISPPETLAIFTSKIKQQYAFESAKLPVPPHATTGNMIAKPEYGRGGKGHVRTDVKSVADALAVDAGYLVQQFIDGDEYTIDVLTDMDGKCLFALPRLRIQTNGVSIVGRIVRDTELVLMAHAIVEIFSFRGPINIQMIREKGTGKVYIIEVNARLSGSCMFSVRAGFDILDATIRLYQGLPFVEPEVSRITVRRHYEESIA